MGNTTTVKAMIDEARQSIAAQADLSFSSPQQEARILFENATGKNSAWQIAHENAHISIAQCDKFQANVAQRLSGKPIAFIIGYQAFWSLELAVSPCTLIPRQDTEVLVEVALSLPLPTYAKAVDLGTGTGAIALAMAKERKNWQVQGVDMIADAVKLAQENAKANAVNAEFLQSNWFSALEAKRFDLIVSNPPYVEDDSEYLTQGDLRFEPKTALVSGKQGLEDIYSIIEQAPLYLTNHGWLVLEHGHLQAPEVASALNSRGFVHIAHKNDYNGIARVTLGQWIDNK